MKRVFQLRGLVNDRLFMEFNCHFASAECSVVKLIITSSHRGYTEPTLAEGSAGEGLHVNERLLSSFILLFTVFRAKTTNLLIDLASTSHLH